MGTESSIKELLAYLSNGTGNYSQKYLEENFGELFKIAIELKLLQKTQPLKEILCPICDSQHFVAVTSDDKNSYACCELLGIMEKVDRNTLVGYRLLPSAFAEWLAVKLNLTSLIEQLENKVWYLGQTTGNEPNLKVYFICSDDFDFVLNKYNPDSMVYLWNGEVPYNRSISKNLISVKDLLLLNGTLLEIDKSPFKALTELLTTKVEEVILRTDSAIRKENIKHYLLLGRNASLQNFNHKESISPKSYELLKFASKPKVLKTGFTLEDAVNEDIAENKRTISKYIKELNDKCTNNEIPEILIKADKTHWKLDSPYIVNGDEKDF